ncbi:DUF6261 family protein [Mangrovibacterium lignilyticum]|uniref:DUF6261 family protein n=1 Tax=Mangrovibacterium lignilyticum TaxID=2668052 RepID=UPI0013D734C1|nr:DUF6261 family protein [Mangrovibacterium lignilyticum]
MDIKTFSPLYVGRLGINDLFSLNQATIDTANPVIVEIGGIPQATLTNLVNTNSAMGARMNKAQREELTPKVKAADKDRDQCFGEIKREISAAVKSRNTSKSEAGNKLKIFLDPYWEIHTGAMNTETEIIAEMLSKYASNDELKAAAATLTIDDLFTELGTLNATFNALYTQRNATEASEAGPSASNLRPDAEKAYEQFCTAIEQAANFTPSATITTLFNQLDVLRKKYAPLISKSSNGQPANPAAEAAD